MSPLRIHRYIFREVAIPSLLGLLIFTFVLFMGRILRLMDLVINKGVPVTEIVKLFLCLLPSFLVITLPLAFLLGVLIGFGRLSAENEVVAMKSCGIGLYAMARPVLVLALMTCALTALLTIKVNPESQAAFASRIFKIATTRATVGLRPRVFNDEFNGLVLYADAIDEHTDTLKGVFISDERSGAIPATILAEKGSILRNKKDLVLTLRLRNGTIHRRPRDKGKDAYQTVSFSTYDISLNMGRHPESRQRKISELSWTELRRALRTADSSGRRNRYLAEMQERLALPFAPLVFALIGLPLGIQSQRTGRGSGFAMALGVFLAYYLLLSFGETLAEKGGLSSVPLIWAPNLIFFFGGLFLLHRTAVERPLALFEWLAEGPSRILRRLGHRRKANP
jgi:lipopolysaccharide export system permease protein